MHGQNENETANAVNPICNQSDYVVMLLSADWLFDCWSILGIEVATTEAQSIREGCRKIVAEMMGDDHSYYLITFTSSRRFKTYRNLVYLLEQNGVTEAMQERLDNFIGDQHISPFSLYNLDIISQWIVEGKLQTNVALPSQRILDWLASAWKSYYDNRLDLVEEWEEASHTEWDEYLKKIMEDTSLSTILVINARNQINLRIWEQAIKELTMNELDQMKEFAEQVKVERSW